MVDLTKFSLITFFTVISLYLCTIKSSQNAKLLINVFALSFYVYCGSGLSFNDMLFNEYLLKYYAYLILFMLTLRVTSDNTKGLKYINTDYRNAWHLVSLGAYIYIIMAFVGLVYPEFKLHYIFMPPKMSTENIFFYASRNQNDIMLKLVMTLQNLLLPIYLIYLNVLIIKGKKIKAVVIFLALVYVDYVSREYISRNEILRYALLIISMLFVIRQNGLVITRKLIVCCVLMIVTMIPIFLGMQSYRLGGDFVVQSLTDAFLTLWRGESDYSKYYPYLTSRLIDVKDYLLWLIFLPIPSILWRGKPAVYINDIFTEHILGLVRGDQYFYVILPSLLGESFMVFGQDFYWFQALLCGAITAYLFKSLYCNRYLRLNYIYFLSQFLFIARGGTPSFLPPLINSVVAICIFNFFVNALKLSNGVNQNA
ncbi:hypothetical protein [Cloacibacillus evryensis]|uniref:hypothetical protein n=1 Tax=Cloacibacillus evryensis TaxID=508460 RepID=UPI0022E4518E|nr:hypothetical protein [Cloacibacillus evryensis]